MTTGMDPASTRYAHTVRDTLAAELGSNLVAVYVYGSALSSEFVPGWSDLDALAITERWLHWRDEQRVLERLGSLRRPSTLKGLDLWVLPRWVAQAPRPSPGFQFRLLTSRGSVYRDVPWHRGDPRLAMLLAICRSQGVPLIGPPPRTLLGPVERPWLLAAMLDDLATDAPLHYAVLNACRDLYFLETGRLSGKLTGAAWARERVSDPYLVDQAVAWQRTGTGPELDPRRVESLVWAVAARLGRGADPLTFRAAKFGQRRGLAPRAEPVVSCIMPTYNRRRFAAQAIRLFLHQDYPRRELVIVDDGEDPIGDMVPAGGLVRYHRLSQRATIGEKRNLACSLARGDILVQWDDDDWYGPARLHRQVAPLVAGTADATAVFQSWMIDLRTGTFFRRDSVPAELKASLAAGTLSMTRELWQRCGTYPDASWREDVTMLYRALDHQARVQGVDNDGIYVYVRHGLNSSRFARPPELFRGWTAVDPPDFLPPSDLALYGGGLPIGA